MPRFHTVLPCGTIVILVAFQAIVVAQLPRRIGPIRVGPRPIERPRPIDVERELERDREAIERYRRNIRNLDPRGASEEGWGEAGRIAYIDAARTMRARSPRGERLDGIVEANLKREFGDLVDRLRIHWGVSGLDEWTAEAFKISLTGTESEAQTYGYDIYVKWNKGQKDDETVAKLLVHECVHSQQFEEFGRSYSNFGYHYFKEYKRAGQSYENNKLEKEAFKKEEQFRFSNQPAPAPQRALAEGVYSLQNVAVGKYLDIEARDGTTALHADDDHRARRWEFRIEDNNVARIENLHGRSNDQGGRGYLAFRDNRVVLLPRAEGADARWQLTQVSDGVYLLKNMASGQYLDVNDKRDESIVSALADPNAPGGGLQWRLKRK
jgi:hypothetical protein